MAIPDDPAAFEEAVRAFRDRVPMSDAEWDALTAAQREFAFKVAGAAQADLVNDVWQALEHALGDGTDFAEFKAAVGDQLIRSWRGTVANPAARLETIFRTNVQGAYGKGAYQQRTAAAVKKARPYWRFDGVGDSRQSNICRSIDGTIRPASDPFWKTHQPPLHHNCRSAIVALSPEEARAEGVTDEAPEVDAAEGFGTVPAAEGEDWAPDPKDYPKPLGELLQQKLAGNE